MRPVPSISLSLCFQMTTLETQTLIGTLSSVLRLLFLNPFLPHQPVSSKQQRSLLCRERRQPTQLSANRQPSETRSPGKFNLPRHGRSWCVLMKRASHHTTLSGFATAAALVRTQLLVLKVVVERVASVDDRPHKRCGHRQTQPPPMSRRPVSNAAAPSRRERPAAIPIEIKSIDDTSNFDEFPDSDILTPSGMPAAPVCQTHYGMCRMIVCV